jgi:hypothetical protein
MRRSSWGNRITGMEKDIQKSIIEQRIAGYYGRVYFTGRPDFIRMSNSPLRGGQPCGG